MSLGSSLAAAAVDVGAAIAKKLLADASDDEVVDALRAELLSYRNAQRIADERAKSKFGGSIKL